MKKYITPQIKTVMFSDESVMTAAVSMNVFETWQNDLNNGSSLRTSTVEFQDALKLVF